MIFTANQQQLLDGLAAGKAASCRKRDKNPWLDCAGDTYRTACSLKTRGLVELHEVRAATGDYKARLTAAN